MFSRILYSNQSPKKSKPDDVIDLTDTTIIQSSSEEELSQVLITPKKRKQHRLPPTQSPPICSQTSENSMILKVKPLVPHAISSVANSERTDLSEQNSMKSEVQSPPPNTKIMYDLDSDSSSSMFENENDLSQVLGVVDKRKLKTKNNQCIVKEEQLFHELPNSSSKSCKRSSSSKETSLEISTTSSKINDRGKKWNKASVSTALPLLPHTSPKKVHSLHPKHKSLKKSYDFDIYEYVPSFSDLAVKKKQEFADWFFHNHSTCLCVVVGPTGSGKVFFILIHSHI